MVKRIVILLIVFIIFLFLGFKQKEKQKLLVYITTIKGETELYFKNTDSIPNICVKLNIDTIYSNKIVKCKKTNSFFYKGQTFGKNQLFDLDDYYKLKKCQIIFSICSTVVDPQSCDDRGCTGNKWSRYVIDTTIKLSKIRKKAQSFWLNASINYEGTNNVFVSLNSVKVVVYPPLLQEK